MKKPLFKINWDDVIDTKDSSKYVTTDPPHPHGEVRPDRNKKYVYLHIAVMELHLGRYLKKGEEVHHKDENPSNNALSNLVLTTHDEHQVGHAKKKKFWKKSPMNKPGRPSARKVAAAFFSLKSSSGDLRLY